MPDPVEIVVQSRKHDGRVNRSWTARLMLREGPLIILEGVFAEEVRHPFIGLIEAGTVSTEVYWADRWYSVFRFQTPDGRLLKFYCNINTPPSLEAGVLSYVDLDVDVLVETDFSHVVLDEEEFERHAEIYGYPPLYRARVREAVEEILRLACAREFPFSLNLSFTNDVTREGGSGLR
jgi:protein associated with RNAse G/E